MCALAFTLAAFCAVALSARAATTPPAEPAATIAPQLAGMAFLVGTWTASAGHVADTNQTSRGTSTMTFEANGSALLRRDHTDLFDANGTKSGGFDQIMLIYVEGDAVHATYTDGTHVIHYVTADVHPGRSVTFATPVASDSPSFRLTYELADADALDVRFDMKPPGQPDFRPVATGTLRRDSSTKV